MWADRAPGVAPPSSPPAPRARRTEQGDRLRAYRILRENIDGLLDTDYTDVTRMIAVEFITMMAAIDRLADAAGVLTYLDTTGDYGTLARDNLVADAVRRIDADPDLADDHGRKLDAHGALVLMRDTLDELTAEPSPAVTGDH